MHEDDYHYDNHNHNDNDNHYQIDTSNSYRKFLNPKYIVNVSYHYQHQLDNDCHGESLHPLRCQPRKDAGQLDKYIICYTYFICPFF